MKTARSASTCSLMRHAVFIALLGFASLALFGCNYSEMRDDEAVQAYNEEFPQMPKKTIPVDGGVWVEREANPMELVDPLADDSKMRCLGVGKVSFLLRAVPRSHVGRQRHGWTKFRPPARKPQKF